MKNEKKIEEIINYIATEKTNNYGNWTLPCQVDEDISYLINEFIKIEPQNRDEFRKRFSTIEHFDMLRTFSERMSIRAVREQQPRWIFEGLIAHTIEDFRFDYRENMLVICLLDNSARKIGVNLIELFDKAAEYATLRVAKVFKDYVRIPISEKRIELMGYEEIMREDGFWYKRNW